MKEKTEATTLSKVEVSFAGITFNMEGPEVFVREGWKYLRNQLLPHLERTLQGHTSVVPKKLERPEKQLTKFYKEKRPKSQPETITVFAHYLKHREGKEEFMPLDLRRLYENLGLPISRKIAQSTWDAYKKRGFLIKGSKRGLYKISPKGEEFVRKQLPKKK
jgi:hypothetical protein